MILAIATALVLTGTPVDTVRAQAASDSAQTVSDSDPIRVRPVLPLGALYSGTFSVGLGAGVGIDNVTAFGALHGYGAALTLSSGDLDEQPIYGLLHGEISRATRRRFFGAGPFSDKADRLELDHTSATVEARLGAYPLLTTALIVQPSARLLIDRLDALDPDTDAALRQLDPSSQAATHALVEDTRTGISFGLELASDRLDWHDYPSRGTYASVEARRFVAFDDSDLRFTRVSSSISGYVPLGRRTVLFGHATGVITRQDDRTTLPFVYLPTLDNDLLLAYATDRFRGRDALAMSVGVRAPVLTLYELFGLDAELTGTLGSVYTDVFDQFDPSISFDAPILEPGTVPLRPAASIGLRAVNLDTRSMYIGGRIGVSPEGLSVALVSLTADLRDVVPLFR